MLTEIEMNNRLATIKKIAQRKKKIAQIKAQSNSVMRNAPKVKRARGFMVGPTEDTSKNINYYTDASKYANQYYGNTFRETTKFDSTFANGDWE